jgi:hypothetical protein
MLRFSEAMLAEAAGSSRGPADGVSESSGIEQPQSAMASTIMGADRRAGTPDLKSLHLKWGVLSGTSGR